nr:ATP-dependent transcriptional regulator [Paracoccaceae bacterium]
PGLLARLNPAGGAVGSLTGETDPRSWGQAIETALGQRGSDAARRAAAERAVGIARAQGWRDNRLAFSYYALGRVNVGSDVPQAVIAFAEAQRIYQGLPGGAVHAAHVDMQMAAFALSSGQADEAMRYTDRAIPVVRQAENAALLATLLLLKAEALDLAGRGAEASALRLDTADLARYGFGGDAQVRARTSEIAALGRRGGRG